MGTEELKVVDILHSGIDIFIWNLEHELDPDISFVLIGKLLWVKSKAKHDNAYRKLIKAVVLKL